MSSNHNDADDTKRESATLVQFAQKEPRLSVVSNNTPLNGNLSLLKKTILFKHFNVTILAVWILATTIKSKNDKYLIVSLVQVQNPVQIKFTYQRRTCLLSEPEAALFPCMTLLCCVPHYCLSNVTAVSPPPGPSSSAESLMVKIMAKSSWLRCVSDH